MTPPATPAECETPVMTLAWTHMFSPAWPMAATWQLGPIAAVISCVAA